MSTSDYDGDTPSGIYDPDLITVINSMWKEAYALLTLRGQRTELPAMQQMAHDAVQWVQDRLDVEAKLSPPKRGARARRLA
eukprot:5121349-Amphidinium_carterae.1